MLENVLTPAIVCALDKSTKFFVLLPVPPLATGRTPVMPGVMFAVPSKLAAVVLAKFVCTVRAVFNFSAVVNVAIEEIKLST
jgi:hypothetical protein